MTLAGWGRELPAWWDMPLEALEETLLPQEVLPAWGELTLFAWEEALSAWGWVPALVAFIPSWGEVLPAWEELLPAWGELDLAAGGALPAQEELTLATRGKVLLAWVPRDQVIFPSFYINLLHLLIYLSLTLECLNTLTLSINSWHFFIEVLDTMDANFDLHKSLCLALYPRRLLMEFTLAWIRSFLLFW